MKSLIRVELDKAFRNRWFAVAIFSGLALAMVAAVQTISVRGANIEFAVGAYETPAGNMKFSSPYAYNCFASWMSVDSTTLASWVFFRTAPLLAVVPYAWSLGSELRSGYASQVVTRSGKRNYIGAKALATFLVGGTVVALPLATNLFVVACYFPAYVPEVYDAMYNGIFDDNLWSYYFYNAPLVYVLLYLALDFVLCGLWAVFTLSAAVVCRNRVLALTTPYLCLLGLQFVNERIFLALGGIRGFQLSLFENLRAFTANYVQNGWIILGEGLVLLLASAVLFAVFLRKDVL